MDVIHMSFGDSAYGNLKYVFQKSKEHQNEQIICINEDFSIGPLYKLESEEGMQERKQWLKQLLTQTGSVSDTDYLDWIETTLKNNLQVAIGIPNNSKVILWHGDNTSDEIGLRFVAFLLQNKSIQFETVNVTVYSRYIGFTVRDLQNKEVPDVIRSLGEMPPNLILDALQMKKSVSNIKIEILINDWKEWSQTKGILRILLDGKVVAVSEDYYDASILENTPNEYQRASYVVGEVMGKIEQCIGDTYLTFRVQQLIQQRKLSYQGDVGFLSKMEIRLP
ncbi:DUF1835 domain-containing protein [Paenibacillus sp. SYP-B3998]|uniref:DUF1835 domain-containing protein n=1 Tax=Paenibacillus sp. SYP-B3998 TaxID=2678564 RepID=A0A6G4A2B9_9BACL|nr:DUF1835 domain-containing protein [Paenibacillus sp. SYP-B3998]NEW08525.1 DUF1835 domain-containing protein [Paenibacillus sp. SYP-B3998]